MTVRLAALALLGTAVWGQQLTTWHRRHNTFLLQFDNGAAQLELVSNSAFRYERGRFGPPRRALSDAEIACKATGGRQSLRIETADIVITVEAGLARVDFPGGLRMFEERAYAASADGMRLELAAGATEQFYGFGPRPEEALDARGLKIETETPFFVSSKGYAFWLSMPGRFTFDVGRTVKIEGKAARIEYFFAFGPSLKEIWHERLAVVAPPETPVAEELGLIPAARLPRRAVVVGESSLCGDWGALLHSAFSGVLLPAFDLGRYAESDVAEYRRAAFLGVYAPLFAGGGVPEDPEKARVYEAAGSLRSRFLHYLLTYADEMRARGYPLWHPLRMQFPQDALAAESNAAVMFGDELMLVPACRGARSKELYLPMGSWTDLWTDRVYAGRTKAEVEIPEEGIAVLARNSTIVPLSGETMELHYFPRSGGEFFLYEPEVANYSQAHAGPALDVYRLQMESKVSRRYEWVVHHMDRPRRVEQVGRGAIPWSYDEARRQVRVPLECAAGSDVIVNLVY